MSQYTVEQVEACILAYRNGDLNYCRAGIIDLLTAYAATLKAAQGGVTEAMVERIAGIMREDCPGSTETQIQESARRIAALSAQQGQGEAWDARGGSLWLDREQWGVVIDALIEHRASAAKRKNGNPDSTSDVRADECGDLIGKITSAAKSITAPPAQPADSKVIGADSQIKPERVPEGWVLVPREPTEQMLDAALKLQGDDAFLARAPAVLSAFVKVYRAMLDATPAPSPARGDGYTPPKPCTCLTVGQRNYCADRDKCSVVTTQDTRL